jgi:hypothetical protein
MSDQEDTGVALATPERIVIGIAFGNSNSSIAFTSKVSSSRSDAGLWCLDRPSSHSSALVANRLL